MQLLFFYDIYKVTWIIIFVNYRTHSAFTNTNRWRLFKVCQNIVGFIKASKVRWNVWKFMCVDMLLFWSLFPGDIHCPHSILFFFAFCYLLFLAIMTMLMAMVVFLLLFKFVFYTSTVSNIYISALVSL